MSDPAASPDVPAPPGATRSTWIELSPGFAACLTLPPGGRGPGLLLWQEIFGVNEHIRALAQQYALAGFTVLAPDAFWRQAPRVALGYTGSDRERALQLMQGYGAGDALADIATATAALRGLPAVQASGGRIGTLGWCMGGRMAYLTAATQAVDAAVCWYGGGIQHQLQRAAQVRAPVLLHYAEHDDHIPLDAVEQVRAALAARPAPAVTELHVYPGAHHGFNCWARASWHAGSAALAQGRTLVFLARHLHGA